ncbi:MAG: 3-oxoacyl-[acyl-carrier-protein] reductase [Sphaerochaetaceae bacterium]|nr:3-oxoacyl-[acyl-carrier-protein] reductase [Sphaerochaetaceae bacterium]
MSNEPMYEKRALVTGGSRGIGGAIVKELALREYEVFYFSRSANGENIPHTHHIAVDMSDSEDIEKALNRFSEMSGTVDVLVNNAGITRDGLLMRMSSDAWDQVMSVNLRSVYQVSQYISRIMMKKRRGSIISISSIVGLTGNGGQANYAASKAAVIGFSKSIAKELSARNIRVNVIAPGFIATQMSDAIPENIKEKFVEQIPMKRIGTVEEISKVVAFLASDDASYITGQVITVDGGMVM